MTSQPGISLIIPAHNAAHFLRQTLPAALAGLSDGDELIVVDDCSTDDTYHVAEEFGATVIRLDSNTGPSGARNAGAAIATRDILAFLDADVEAHADTLPRLRAALAANSDTAAVFGSYDNAPADPHLVSQFKNLMHHHVHQTGNQKAQTFWTGCGAIRRHIFNTVGPFNRVSLSCVEDIDYGHRLRDAGYHIQLDPTIQCRHLKRWTLLGLIRTDVLQRGIPWTIMMLRRGKMDADLNLGWKHRVSAILATIFTTAIILALLVDVRLLIPAALALMIFLWLQRDFYRTLASSRGPVFAAACVPLHILYFIYSLASLLAGIVLFQVGKRQQNVAP